MLCRMASNRCMNTAIKLPYPVLFISHGSPMTALEPREAGAFMQQLGRTLEASFGRPRAILAISAHTLARAPTLLAGKQHAAVYDFGGFDPRLNLMRYDAPGAPALAQELMQSFAAAGLPLHSVDQGGLDHGIWTPLRFMFPDASIPVLPLAFVPSQSPAEQFALGKLLQGLSEQGVLIMASGSITHNLRAIFAGRQPAIDAAEVPESAAFRGWMRSRSSERDWDALLDYRRQAPHAVAMHPTDEHLLPWFVAAGVGGREHAPERLHDSLTFGCLGMDAYAFGPNAHELHQALQSAAAANDQHRPI